jgi:hypothetical protein|tara:strand:+ start:9426 stop:10157 length:732 start_codon:yes stop_codon:yes gene_type:complete
LRGKISQISIFETAAPLPEPGQPPFKTIGKKGQAGKIFGRSLAMRGAGLGKSFLPFFRRIGSPADPAEGNQFDLLSFVQCTNYFQKFPARSILRKIFRPAGIEGARPRDDATNLSRIEREHADHPADTERSGIRVRIFALHEENGRDQEGANGQEDQGRQYASIVTIERKQEGGTGYARCNPQGQEYRANFLSLIRPLLPHTTKERKDSRECRGAFHVHDAPPLRENQAPEDMKIAPSLRPPP